MQHASPWPCQQQLQQQRRARMEAAQTRPRAHARKRKQTRNCATCATHALHACKRPAQTRASEKCSEVVAARAQHATARHRQRGVRCGAGRSGRALTVRAPLCRCCRTGDASTGMARVVRSDPAPGRARGRGQRTCAGGGARRRTSGVPLESAQLVRIPISGMFGGQQVACPPLCKDKGVIEACAGVRIPVWRSMPAPQGQPSAHRCTGMRQPAPASAQSGGPSSRASSAGDALRGLPPRPPTLPALRGSSERALSMLMRSLPLPLLLEPARPRPRLRPQTRRARL